MSVEVLGFNSFSMEFSGISMGFKEIPMELHAISMGFHGISTGFHGILFHVSPMSKIDLKLLIHIMIRASR
jgi:hypothetical protein